MKYIILILWTFILPLNAMTEYVPMICFYVSPVGNDTNTGTEEAPFRTFQRAVAQVDTVRNKCPKQRVTIYFREGLYRLSHSVRISHQGNGPGGIPVIYAAYPGENPVFSGSIPLQKWEKIRNKEMPVQLSPSARKYVYVTDVNEKELSDLGDPIKSGNRPELFYKGKQQTIARWPNTGFTHAGKAIGKTSIPPALNGNSGTKEGLFEYLDSKIDLWNKEQEGIIAGYWFWDWDNGYQKIQKIDTLKKTLQLKDTCGYRHGLRFYGMNLLCELDTVGEWYLDKQNKKLYWYAPVKTSSEINKQPDVTLSAFNAPFMVDIQDCSCVTLEGLSFIQTRGSGIQISNGSNCRIRNCRIEGIGQDGIVVTGGYEHAIESCYLNTLGHNGVKLTGGDRKTLTPANHSVIQTVIEDFALFTRTYSYAIQANGCGMYFAHNRLAHASSSAFTLGGNDMIVEYNQIEQVVTESDDQGGFDLYLNPSFQGLILRYNHWSHINGGTHYGAAAIRLDDLISGVAIYGNIFEQCGSFEFGAVQIHGGNNNLIEDNLFYQCNKTVSFTPYGTEDWQIAFDKLDRLLYEEVDIRSPLYQRKYPELRTVTENIDINVIRNNLCVDCQSLLFKDNGIQITSGNHKVVSGKHDVYYYCSPSLLQTYGIKPIPVKEIGVTHNTWINNEK